MGIAGWIFYIALLGAMLYFMAIRPQKKERQKQQDAEAAERRSQIGTGDRSEKIRTYNFPQGRVTDHRIGLTVYKLEEVLNGNLDLIVEPLLLADREEKLKQMNTGEQTGL